MFLQLELRYSTVAALLKTPLMLDRGTGNVREAPAFLHLIAVPSWNTPTLYIVLWIGAHRTRLSGFK